MAEKPGLDPDDTRSNAAPAEMMKDTAYARIEALLNSGGLRPGQLVSQRELVLLTDTTLGSIREAISRLQTEGLLIALPKRGLMVPSIDVRFVREAYELRKVLEMSAVDAAIQNLTLGTLSAWITQHEQARKSAAEQTQQQADEFQELDWDVHNSLIGAMNNDIISNIYRVNSIKIRMAVQVRLRVTPFNAERVIKEHLNFLIPMRDRNADDARMALEQHIENSLILALGGKID